MELSDEEYALIEKAIEKIKAIFDHEVERSVKRRYEHVDNKFVNLLRENYITTTGLVDFIEDYGLVEEETTVCSNGCRGPCKATCVKPCKSCFRPGHFPNDCKKPKSIS